MGNSSTKEKGAAKVAIVQEQPAANESPEKAASVTSFAPSPEKDFTPPPKTKQKSAVDIESARPVMVNEPPIQHKKPAQVEEQHQEQVSTQQEQEQEQPKPIVVPAPQALKPLKSLKPLGWSIEDEEAAKVDKAEKENMLMNKRIELDRKRLERKMEKQRQKELKEQEKLRKQKENATKEEKAAQEEQKTTQELLEEEEAKCLEAMKQMCSPTIGYNLTSETWAHRKEGIEQIQKFIEDSARNLNQVAEEVVIHQFCAMTIVLRKFFQDRVAPVFYAAYDCFRCLLNVYGKYLFDSKEVSYALQSIIPPLITSMGGESTGTNRRTQREACRCVLRVARLTEIDGLGLIVQLLKVDTIAIRPRLALLKILLQEFSLDDESARGCRLTLKLVFDMCEPALNHSDDKVRKAGVDDIVLAYSMVGDNVRQYICNVKPAMLKVLEEKFDEIDRKKTGAPSSSRGVLSPQKRDDTLSQIQRDKEKKRGKKGGENIMGLLNPVVLTKTNSQRGDNFMNQLQNSSSSGSFLDQQAAKGRKKDNKDNAPYLSSTVGANSSLGSRLSSGNSNSNSENPERDSPPSPRNRDDSNLNDSKVYRGDTNVNRALFADLADGSYGNGGNGSFRNSPSGLQQVDSRFHICD